eukprot:TRINITY_DN24767_c0_g1_i1.p1 TRINITY_DN24767_c0_g1~~TRINITY_DN24767_c0_g1_i1.p1  ORF type:complete len:355 (-),score=40.25 TRINITY_DN24767_c0_g1_i1:244-1308(-)
MLLQGLSVEKPSAVNFQTASWGVISKRGRTNRVPYADQFSQLNESHGEYKRFNNEIYISSCSAHELAENDLPFDTEVGEKAALLRPTCPETDKVANFASKRAVVFINLRESGFFGHAVDNVLPRVTTILGGLRRSNFTLTLVLPRVGRRSLSPATVELCKALGFTVQTTVPVGAHRAIGVSRVASWDRAVRQSFVSHVRSSQLLKDTRPSDCAALATSNDFKSFCRGRGIFLGRGAGARNQRKVFGGELLEAAFKDFGFRIESDAGSLPLKRLAAEIYSQKCCLAAWYGTAMSNLIFLPSRAHVIELNPYNIYANFWQWSVVLGFSYKHLKPPKTLSQENATYWANLAFTEDSK